MPGGVLLPIVAKRCRGQEFSILEPLLQRPVHGFALLDRLLLCERGEKGEHELGVLCERIQIVRFKENADGWCQAFQHTDQGNAIHQVSCKTGYALCKNEIVFAFFARFDHCIELVPVLE